MPDRPKITTPKNLDSVPETHPLLEVTRCSLLGRAATGIGAIALGTLMGRAVAAPALARPHQAPKAKRVIYLVMGGGPSHVDLFDPKPAMHEHAGEEMPVSIMKTTMLATTQNQKKFPVLPGRDPFVRYGKCGMEMSTLIPHTGSIADKICFVRSATPRSRPVSRSMTGLRDADVGAGVCRSLR